MNRRTFAAALSAAATQAAGPQVRVALITHADGPHLSAYIPALADTPEVASVSLSDPGGANIAAVRRALGPRLGGVYDSPGELFKKEKPDLALITMEAKLAPPAIHAALDAGCHVMAEKPACVRLADFEALAAKAQSSNRHLMLALGNRVDPYVVEMLRIIQGGHIGKVYGVELHIVADQTRLTRPAYHKTWVAQKSRAAGGHLIWLGIHWLDLAMFLTKSKIREVAGFTANVGGQPIDTEDSAVVAMRFDNGTLGTITSGYYLDKGYHSMLKVWGSHGWAEMRKHGGPGVEWYSTKEAAPVIHRVNKDNEPTGYTPFVQSVVRAVAGLQPPPLTTADSLHALKVVFAAYRAAETGCNVVI
jgi:UDP-N-acetyl-2-amino-2-deoxyglucuronate dehydrogenase